MTQCHPLSEGQTAPWPSSPMGCACCWESRDVSATIFRYSKASIRWLYTCSGIFTRSCTYTGSGSCVVLPEMLMLMSNSSLDGGQILCGFGLSVARACRDGGSNLMEKLTQRTTPSLGLCRCMSTVGQIFPPVL